MLGGAPNSVDVSNTMSRALYIGVG